MKKQWTYLLIALLIVSIIQAVTLTDLGVFKQGSEVRITQVCSDASYINISSVTYPNGTVAVSNIEMTSSGSGEYYYNFNSTNISGRYDVRGISDGCENTFATYFEINLSGSERNITVIIADILLIIFLSTIIFFLHKNYSGKDYSDSENKIADSHKGNWGKTFIKTMMNNFMRNSFLWYYSLGWFILIVMKDLVYNFSSQEIYGFFVLFLDIYSFGFFLIIIVWIGILIKHFEFIVDLINDMNLGVSR